MKSSRIAYWIVTILLCGFMLFSAISSIMVAKGSPEVFRHFQFPEYLIVFTGVAKLLAVIAILVPGFPRLKEWAYAGLTFDLVGVMYGSISVGDPVSAWAIFLIFIALVFASYFLYHKIRRGVTAS